MKFLIAILAFFNGGFMLLDGVFVLIKGKYIGPEKPGPWANLFYKFNIDVFKLAPLFIGFGLLWLIWLYGLWTAKDWAFTCGIVVSVLTLWYLPIETLISLVILVLLLIFRIRLGL